MLAILISAVVLASSLWRTPPKLGEHLRALNHDERNQILPLLGFFLRKRWEDVALIRTTC